MVILSDPGSTAHVANLPERFSRLGMSLTDVTTVVLTHCDADRMGGLALLRHLVPNVQVAGSAQMARILESESAVRAIWDEDRALTSLLEPSSNTLQLSFEEFRAALRIDRHLVDSDTITVDEETAVRMVSTPGHRTESVAYLVLPHEFVIVDETFGYFQGRRLAAPGADFNLETALASMKKFDHMEVSGIGFSYTGAITGELVRKHLEAMSLNSSDIVAETQRAIEEGIAEEEIRTQIRDAFYVTPLRDPCLRESLSSSFEAIWKQIRAAK